jgi:hypothetical protein
MLKVRHIAVLSGALLLGACSSDSPPINDCMAGDGMQPLCLFQNPEDLVLLPDGKTLLISQMGPRMGYPDPGSLVFLDTRSGQVTAAFPVDDPAAGSSENWGTEDCPGNPGASIAPHGIALRQRDDLRWQVAAVNHGGRESVEMFELLESEQGPQLQWRGCVVTPPGIYMNDLALLGNGGLVASHMFDSNGIRLFGLHLNMFKTMAGMQTGHVFEWQPASGFRVLEDSHGAMLNGIEISSDDQHVFAAVYFGGEIKKLERLSGKQLGTVAHKASGQPELGRPGQPAGSFAPRLTRRATGVLRQPRLQLRAALQHHAHRPAEHARRNTAEPRRRTNGSRHRRPSGGGRPLYRLLLR